MDSEDLDNIILEGSISPRRDNIELNPPRSIKEREVEGCLYVAVIGTLALNGLAYNSAWNRSKHQEPMKAKQAIEQPAYQEK